MKKHKHINSIPTKESATTIEWDIIDKKPRVEIEVENADIIRGSFFKETLAPSFWTLTKNIMIGLKKPLMALRYRIHKTASNVGANMDFDLKSKFQNKDVPWLKIGLVLFAGYVLLHKDMHFNFNLSSPFAVVADDDNEDAQSTNYAQSISNPYAPVSSKALSKMDVQSFIDKYVPIAKKEMELYQIPASIKMGQALIESRAGTSKLARNNNNFFGMKCFSKNCKKGHCSNATDDHHKDFFRKYRSVANSFRAHSTLLSGARYKSLKKYGNDYKKWAKGLKKQGYATDKTYDKKLINVIEKYKLYQYDS